MQMTHWVALGREADGYVGYAISGSSVSDPVRAGGAGDVLAKLDAAETPVVRIGQGDACALPCPVLPDAGGVVSALEQANPADLISAWVRLWVAGYLADRPYWDGLAVVVHGDVVHWLHISADEVVSSASSLTPRLHAAMGLDQAGVKDAAIADTLSRPERLMTHLRAAELRGDAGACLGHFIGADLAATRAYWLGQQAVVIGGDAIADAYCHALGGQGVPVEPVDPDALTPRGLVALGSALWPEG